MTMKHSSQILSGASLVESTVVCPGLSFFVLIVDLSLPLGVAGGVPYIAVVLISLRSNNVRFTLSVAILCTVLTCVGFFFSPEGGELWKVVANRVLAFFAIWVTALLAMKVIAEAQRELKTLSGLLPICASCKKIRDDKGYWNQIESYIHTHSEAQFSHGMCPACIEENYPDLELEAVLEPGDELRKTG